MHRRVDPFGVLPVIGLAPFTCSYPVDILVVHEVVHTKWSFIPKAPLEPEREESKRLSRLKFRKKLRTQMNERGSVLMCFCSSLIKEVRMMSTLKGSNVCV